MKVSVILCTYNRSESLARALASVARSQLPESIQWEVLVVDNNSRDATRSVIVEFCRRDPSRFRYLFEPKPGKSYALNAGIQAARGEILAFTDDDVTFEPAWLENLTAGLLNGDCAGAGGRTLPEESFSAPRWLGRGRRALGPLAMFDLGEEPRELKEPPFGNNMAYRREVFEKYGFFRTDLGPCPGTEIRGEDTEFGQRLVLGGERLRYQPTAIVYHAVPPNRVQKTYFLNWWFDKGRADVREHGVPNDTNWFMAGVPLYLFRRLAVWTVKWMCGIGPSQRFFGKRQTWWIAGTIEECFHQRRGVSRIPAGGAPYGRDFVSPDTLKEG